MIASEVRCPLCEAPGAREHLPGLRRCAHCTHVFADTHVSDEELSRLYSRGYFFGDEYQDYLAERAALEKNFRLRLRVLERHLSPDRHRRLLEVGCAFGYFLNLVRSRFEKVVGIDLNADGVRHARDVLGVDAREADLLASEELGAEFDVVCLWDTLEHLRDPAGVVARISEQTRAGALLAFTTGDIGSFNARWRGRRWRLIHPPTHLHYFNRTSMERLLARHGFTVVHFEHCGLYRRLEHAFYNLLVLRGRQRWLYAAISRLGLTQMDLYLNLYDVMYVVACRTGTQTRDRAAARGAR